MGHPHPAQALSWACHQTLWLLHDLSNQQQACQSGFCGNLQALLYDTTAGDEVEDLLALLMYAKQQMPQLQAVSCGAIASDYQRLRVEHVRSAMYARASCICLSQRLQYNINTTSLPNNCYCSEATATSLLLLKSNCYFTADDKADQLQHCSVPWCCGTVIVMHGVSHYRGSTSVLSLCVSIMVTC